MKRHSCHRAVRAVVCAALTVACLQAALASIQPFGKAIFSKDSRYHQICVYQNGSIMTLVFGKQKGPTVQTQIDVKEPRKHLLEYSQLAFCGVLHKPQPKSILVVGLGGGMIPSDMHYYFPDASVDVVELDPDVLTVAEKFFGFKQGAGIKAHVRDGRMFVREQIGMGANTKYDIVILDAFNSDYIPFHLMTKEFLEQVQSILSPDGVVVANVFYANRLYDAELATYIKVFGRAQVYMGQNSGNAMILAPGPKGQMLTPQEAVKRAEDMQREHKFAFDLRFVAGRLCPNPRPDEKSMVLTDDRAPVNLLRTQERTGTEAKDKTTR